MSESNDPVQQLRALADLRDAGVLTDDEFERSKARLLEREGVSGVIEADEERSAPQEAAQAPDDDGDAAAAPESEGPPDAENVANEGEISMPEAAPVVPPPTKRRCATPSCTVEAIAGSPWCLLHGLPKKSVSPALLVVVGFVGVLLVLGVIGAMVSLGASAPTPSSGGSGSALPSRDSSGSDDVSERVSSEDDADEAEREPDEPNESDMTSEQRNALAAARSYLDFAGFSRLGLIRQLSSPAGDGYSVADAAFAADNVGADWNEEAVESAKAYLQLTPMSQSGLIRQLSSPAGDHYTLAQARYAASKAY